MISSDLLFDPQDHQYRYKGQKILSVTQAIQGAGLVDYSRVRPDVLERARQRGVAVHTACQYHDEGCLDWTSVDREIMGPVDAWIHFKKDTGFAIVEIETMHVHPLGLYAGRIDRAGVLSGRTGILDIKTYEPEDYTGVQLAGYEEMVRPQGSPRLARWGLYLKENGTYKIREFTDPMDSRVFMACLVVAQFKIQHGGKP